MTEEGTTPSQADMITQFAEMRKTIDEQKAIIEGYEAKSKDYESQIAANKAEISKLTKHIVDNGIFTRTDPNKSEPVSQQKTEAEYYSDLLKNLKNSKKG